MSIDGPGDLEGLTLVGRAVAAALDEMARHAMPGITTAELDELGARVLAAHGARPAPPLAYRFPGATCISLNGALAHGIPSREVELRDGDLVNIDVSAELGGYWADTGSSYPVGAVGSDARRLLDAGRQALRAALAEARAGRRLRNIGRAVERIAASHDVRVITNLCGHGVGRHIHEAPSVPNTWDPQDRTILQEGTVITIEPFLSLGATYAVTDPDGWTLRTADGSLGAQFEHTLVVTAGDPVILT